MKARGLKIAIIFLLAVSLSGCIMILRKGERAGKHKTEQNKYK